MNSERIGKILEEGLKREIKTFGMEDRVVVVRSQLGMPIVVDIAPIPTSKVK